MKFPGSTRRQPKPHSEELGSTDHGTLRLRVFEYDNFRDPLWFGGITARNMQFLGVNKDDFVEVKGQKRVIWPGSQARRPGRAVIRCVPLSQSDSDKDIVRINGLVRTNAGVAFGDTVEVKRVDNVPSAVKVILAPILNPPNKLPNELMYGDYYTDKLASGPIVIDNLLLVPYANGALTLKVVELYPAEIAVVSKDTEFKITTEYDEEN